MEDNVSNVIKNNEIERNEILTYLMDNEVISKECYKLLNDFIK